MGFENWNKTIEKADDIKANVLNITQTETWKLKINLHNQTELNKKIIKVVQKQINELPKILQESLLK
jgi:hypothetical protein